MRTANKITALVLICISVFYTACTSADKYIADNAIIDTMQLDYAEQFDVVYYANSCAGISIHDGYEYLLVPEGIAVPEHSDNQIVLQQPLEHIYMAASSAMDLIDALDSLDKIALTSTKDWSLPDIQNALDAGQIQYAGKYSTPDYELILSEHCNLAVESTMIYHSPDTKEQLEQLGVPVLVERSSYETHPLGRMEWIKLYGLLLDKTEQAEQFFSEKAALFDEILTSVSEADEQPKTVAFFSVSPNGYVTIHKPGDYIANMIQLAGGQYFVTSEDLQIEENALSTMNLQIEAFYEFAADTDILIYNSAINGSLETISQLIEKNSVLADCEAVQTGNVWCTEQNVFQQTTGAADMMYDFYKILHDTQTNEDLIYLHRLT